MLITELVKLLDGMDVPEKLIIVGGGASLLDQAYFEKALNERMSNKKIIILPSNGDVANALGAAKSLIGAHYTQLYSYDELGKQLPAHHAIKTPQELALKLAREAAKELAKKRGADPENLKILYQDELQIDYLPGNFKSVTVHIAGPDTGHGASTPDIYNPPPAFNPSPVLNPTTSSVQSRSYQVTAPSLGHRSALLTQAKPLNAIDIDDMAVGFGLLGSGGGGNPEITRVMVQSLLSAKQEIHMIDAKDLSDAALIVSLARLGSPLVIAEKLMTLDEGVQAIHELEAHMGKKIDALIPCEGAGLNGLYPFFVASRLGIPVVDADFMGRAFPALSMTTPSIYGKFDQYNAVTTNERLVNYTNESSFELLETRVRTSRQSP